MVKRRVVKPATERKAEIVDCALALFLSKGYAATTIADILARTRLSKGAFYHHFMSKDDVLEAAMERLIAAGIAAMRDIVDDEHLDEITRLKQLFVRLGQWQNEMNLDAVTMDMFKPENAALNLRIKAATDRIVIPVLSRIIERGTRNGEFDAPDADLAAEMLLFVGTANPPAVAAIIEMTARGQVDDAMKFAKEHLTARSKMMDRVLGLPPGTMDFVSTNTSKIRITAFVEAVRKAKTKRKA
jgi:AcrR family transcriptional regulator